MSLLFCLQSDQQGVQQQADGEAVRLYRGLQRLSADFPACTELPRPAGGAAQLGPLLPAPHDHLHGGGGPALHPRCLRTHAEGLRGQRPAGVHPTHQSDHRQVQGTQEKVGVNNITKYFQIYWLIYNVSD